MDLRRGAKSLSWRLHLLAFAALGCGSQYVVAGWAPGEKDEYIQSCIKLSREPSGDCAAVAKHRQVPLFASPSSEAAIVGHFPYWIWMAVDWRQPTINGWLRVKSLEDRFRPNDWVWVRRYDVLHDDDYQRVTDCWPISEVFTGIGDTTYRYTFSVRGDGVRIIDGNIDERLQVFVAGMDDEEPIVSFARGSMWMRYSPSRRALIAEETGGEVAGESLTTVRQFDHAQLKRCGNLPLTNGQKRKINKDETFNKREQNQEENKIK